MTKQCVIHLYMAILIVNNNNKRHIIKHVEGMRVLCVLFFLAIATKKMQR